MESVTKYTFVLALTLTIGAGISPAATPNVIVPSSNGNTGAAPIGIAATTGTLLFTQPFCPGQQVRGIYAANPVSGASTLATAFTAANTNLSSCTENYLAISPGLGGFTAGDTYASAASPTTAGTEAVLKNGTLFIDKISGSFQHAGIAFDQAGSFDGALLVFSNGAVIGYGPTGTVLFTYPTPTNYVLEGGAVAPLTYAACPGCLYVTAELATNVNNPNPSGGGVIFRILPGTPSGTAITTPFLTTTYPEPEGLQFVTNNALACTNQGYDYFVSSYASGNQINSSTATNGSILEFTPAQLTPFVGDFLVPSESTGQIFAYSASGAPTLFSSGSFQLEGSSILQCSTKGCPATFGYWKHHAFPASMFVNGVANIGCHPYTASDLLSVLNDNNAGGNAVTILGHQLIAAMANYAAGGSQTTAATQAIGEAIALLCANSIDLTSSFVAAGTPLGQQMTALANILDSYNSSAPGCEGQF